MSLPQLTFAGPKTSPAFPFLRDVLATLSRRLDRGPIARSAGPRVQLWSQAALGERLGMKQPSVSQLLRAETIPTRHHQTLTGLGVPSDLLPAPLDKPRGRPRKVPHWPVPVHPEQPTS